MIVDSTYTAAAAVVADGTYVPKETEPTLGELAERAPGFSREENLQKLVRVWQRHQAPSPLSDETLAALETLSIHAQHYPWEALVELLETWCPNGDFREPLCAYLHGPDGSSRYDYVFREVKAPGRLPTSLAVSLGDWTCLPDAGTKLDPSTLITPAKMAIRYKNWVALRRLHPVLLAREPALLFHPDIPQELFTKIIKSSLRSSDKGNLLDTTVLNLKSSPIVSVQRLLFLGEILATFEKSRLHERVGTLAEKHLHASWLLAGRGVIGSLLSEVRARFALDSLHRSSFRQKYDDLWALLKRIDHPILNSMLSTSD